jgi:hypothetical protein
MQGVDTAGWPGWGEKTPWIAEWGQETRCQKRQSCKWPGRRHPVHANYSLVVLMWFKTGLGGMHETHY